MNSPRRYITRAKSSTPGLAAGDGTQLSPNKSTYGDISSGSDNVAVRTTRASRLRAAKAGLGEAAATSRKSGGPTLDSRDVS